MQRSHPIPSVEGSTLVPQRLLSVFQDSKLVEDGSLQLDPPAFLLPKSEALELQCPEVCRDVDQACGNPQVISIQVCGTRCFR